MRDKLYQYLLERPAGASPGELLDLVFTRPGTDPEFGPRFLEALLSVDPRFERRASDGTWHARVHAVLARPLAETTFVVVDLETTGMAPQASGIIEIGAVRVRGGRVLDEFQQLVNPGAALPPFITRLTGIDDAMLGDQPRLSEVWPRVAAFLGDDVLVAHNARYDLAFLHAAALLHGGSALASPHLCTLKLARRLVPELRRRGLDALAGHFGLPLADRHRALGDARITVEVFFHLLERLSARGVSRLDQALDLQHHARDGRRFVCLLPRDTVSRLPSEPGIYHLLDENGRLLYIGKAKNLRERVSSYLSNAAGHSDKTLDLIRHSRDVRVAVAGSELEAALDEAAAIRRHKPPYNRLGKHLPRIAFLKLTVGEAYPRLAITDRLGAGRARYFGPFRDRQEAEEVRSLLTRLFRIRTCAGRLHPDPAFAPCFQGQIGACTIPCADRVSAADYRQQVTTCVAWLDGDAGAAAAAEHTLLRRREEHAAGLRFEAAAKAQRDLAMLETVARRQRTFAWMTARQNFLVLQPSVHQRCVLAYVVLGGRLALRERLQDAQQLAALAERVRDLWPTQPAVVRREDVDGMTILAAWLRDRGEREGYVLPIPPGLVNAGAPQSVGASLSPAPPPLAHALNEWHAACAALLQGSPGDADS